MLSFKKKKFLSRAPAWSPQIVSQTDILRRLDLMGSCVLILDAGDLVSLPANATKWLDRSGNGYDFHFGAGTGADAGDPVQNGTPGGLSREEYLLSPTGVAYLTYDAANETWMQNLHKNNALFSVACWIYGGGSNLNNSIFGTNGNNPSNRGVYLRAATSTGTLRFECQNGTGTAALVAETTITNYQPNQWNFVAVGVNEANGSGHLIINGQAHTFNATYTSPASTNASFTFQIGARGNAAAFLTQDCRLNSFVAWTSFIHHSDMVGYYNASRGKFEV